MNQRKQTYYKIRRNQIRKITTTFSKISSPDFTWYERAKKFAESIHPNLYVGAGVIAALSPRQHWGINARWAEKTCKEYLRDGILLPQIGTYLVREKVKRILEIQEPNIADILSILNGPKITRFFLNIIGETNPVTLDSWMFSFLRLPEKPGIRMYERTEKAFQRAAEILSLPPRDLQSALWVHIRKGAE